MSWHLPLVYDKAAVDAIIKPLYRIEPDAIFFPGESLNVTILVVTNITAFAGPYNKPCSAQIKFYHSDYYKEQMSKLGVILYENNPNSRLIYALNEGDNAFYIPFGGEQTFEVTLEPLYDENYQMLGGAIDNKFIFLVHSCLFNHDLDMDVSEAVSSFSYTYDPLCLLYPF